MEDWSSLDPFQIDPLGGLEFEILFYENCSTWIIRMKLSSEEVCFKSFICTQNTSEGFLEFA